MADNSTAASMDYSSGGGDASWMLVSTALVYMMTPALGFFYGGLVDHKNVINQLFLSFIVMGLVTVQWTLFGYSFAFAPRAAGFGSFDWGALAWDDIELQDPIYSPTFPRMIHAAYQGAFAVITPAIISGSIVGRMRFSAYVLFILIWSTVCYDALAHWVWASDGWLHTYGAIDFAGGTVVHISSGVSGLVASMILGKRYDFNHKAPQRPAHIPFVVLGASLLWVGWIGFNAGSASAANGVAGVALVNTNAATAMALLTWTMFDAIRHKPSVVGASVGAVVGLVVITPAAGYVSPGWAVFMGFLGVCWVYGWILLKAKIIHYWSPAQHVDDTLDCFSCHGMGGIAGAIMTGLFAQAKYNGVDGSFYGNGIQVWYQLAAVLTTVAFAAGCTAAIMLLLKYTIGVRVSEEKESLGLDVTLHGEVWDFNMSVGNTNSTQKDKLRNDSESDQANNSSKAEGEKPESKDEQKVAADSSTAVPIAPLHKSVPTMSKFEDMPLTIHVSTSEQETGTQMAERRV